MSKAKGNPIVVTVTDQALANIRAVADQLAAKGMQVNQVLPMTGVITGSCPKGKQAALHAVTGVHSVEEEAQVQLPPPESGVQ
jgi:hypothetical protein